MSSHKNKCYVLCSYYVYIVLLYVMVQVRLIDSPDPLNPARRNTYVEVNAGSTLGGYGLLCFDNVDVEMAQVVCRCASPDPKFFLSYRSSPLRTYKG